ncbi:MAG: peptidylprolyl isomerase [Cellulomonadaceae bacterium]|nr:peptidylprolyl isomerase [Cellulomonadaceae bacterium]
MGQTQKQREAAARAKAARDVAAAEQRKHRQRLYAIAAGIVTLGLIAALVLPALFSNRNDTGELGNVAASQFPPNPALAEDRTWQATISTSAGPIEVELNGAGAPQAVASFVALARDGFFDSTICHRLVTMNIFVLQCGDPTATGTGGPNYRFGPIESAPEDNWYPAGTLAMARIGNDGSSMGSQFFLVYEDSYIPADAAGGYTVFGRIVSGLDIVQAIGEVGVAGGATDGRPATDVTIIGVNVQN